MLMILSQNDIVKNNLEQIWIHQSLKCEIGHKNIRCMLKFTGLYKTSVILVEDKPWTFCGAKR